MIHFDLRMRLLLRCCVCMAIASCAWAQAPLTLDDCLKLALQAQSGVTVAGRDVDIAGLGIRQARAAFLPQVMAQTAFNTNSRSRKDPETFSFVSLNAIREYVALGQTAMELDTSGRLRAALGRAKADQDAARAALTITTRDLRRVVTGAYYRALLTRRLVTVAGDVLREATEFRDRVQLLVTGGEAAQAACWCWRSSR